jgi:hypothetical protein
MVGVHVPESGVDTLETSDSVRLSVSAMDGCVFGRGWKMGTVAWRGAEAQDPSRYKLIAARC